MAYPIPDAENKIPDVQRPKLQYHLPSRYKDKAIATLKKIREAYNKLPKQGKRVTLPRKFQDPNPEDIKTIPPGPIKDLLYERSIYSKIETEGEIYQPYPEEFPEGRTAAQMIDPKNGPLNTLPVEKADPNIRVIYGKPNDSDRDFIADMVREIRKYGIAAFDTETGHGRYIVLVIGSIGGQVCIFKHLSDVPPAIQDMLEDYHVVKIGSAIVGDIDLMMDEKNPFPIRVSGFVDTQRLFLTYVRPRLFNQEAEEELYEAKNQQLPSGAEAQQAVLNFRSWPFKDPRTGYLCNMLPFEIVRGVKGGGSPVPKRRNGKRVEKPRFQRYEVHHMAGDVRTSFAILILAASLASFEGESIIENMYELLIHHRSLDRLKYPPLVDPADPVRRPLRKEMRAKKRGDHLELQPVTGYNQIHSAETFSRINRGLRYFWPIRSDGTVPDLVEVLKRDGLATARFCWDLEDDLPDREACRRRGLRTNELCGFCGKNCDHRNNCSERGDQELRCSYPPCVMDEKDAGHTLLNCPILHGSCGACGFRGHVPRHHEQYYNSMPMLENWFYIHAPYGIFTSLIYFLHSDIPEERNKIRSHHFGLHHAGRKIMHVSKILTKTGLRRNEKLSAYTRDPKQADEYPRVLRHLRSLSPARAAIAFETAHRALIGRKNHGILMTQAHYIGAIPAESADVDAEEGILQLEGRYFKEPEVIERICEMRESERREAINPAVSKESGDSD